MLSFRAERSPASKSKCNQKNRLQYTFNHFNGWKTKTSEYVENVLKSEKTMIENSEFSPEAPGQNSELIFRPPYGKMTSKQSNILQKKGYKVVIWDVLSADVDQSISEEKWLQNVIKNTENGSIILFHDSLKAEKNLRYVLPKVLEFSIEKGMDLTKI